MDDSPGLLTGPGRRAASWQPAALGLPFQRDFRAFLKSLPDLGGQACSRQAGHHVMDALKLLDGASIQHMVESLEAKPSGLAPQDWRKELAVDRGRHDNDADMLR